MSREDQVRTFPEDEIRRYWRAERPFDAMHNGFDRLSALSMLREIERLRNENERLRAELEGV